MIMPSSRLIVLCVAVLSLAACGGSYSETDSSAFASTDHYNDERYDNKSFNGISGDEYLRSNNSNITSVNIWRARLDDNNYLRVSGSVGSGPQVTLKLFDANRATELATTQSDSDGRWRFHLEGLSTLPCRVRVTASGASDEQTVDGAAGNCTAAEGGTRHGTGSGTTSFII